MKSFQKKIKLQFLGDMLLIICAIILGYISTRVAPTTSLKFGMGTLAIGFAQCGLFDGIRKARLLYEKDEMKKAYIKFSDERTMLIRSKALSLGLNVCFFLSIFVPFLFPSREYKAIFYTVFVIGISSALLQSVLRKYYKKKYSA